MIDILLFIILSISLAAYLTEILRRHYTLNPWIIFILSYLVILIISLLANLIK